jgi:DNA-binding transcriptional regulator YiaG
MTSNMADVARTPSDGPTSGDPVRGLDPHDALAPETPRPVQIAALQGVIGLRVREIAFAASVSEQTIRNWKKADSHDRPSGYDDLRAIAERLLRADVVDPMLIGAWFRSRNRGLGYTRPLEAIRAGEFARVMDVAESFIALSPPVGAKRLEDVRRRKRSFLAGRDLGKELAQLTGSED